MGPMTNQPQAPKTSSFISEAIDRGDKLVREAVIDTFARPLRAVEDDEEVIAAWLSFSRVRSGWHGQGDHEVTRDARSLAC